VNGNRSCLRSGSVAGLLAGLTLVVFYVAVDVVRGEPFATPVFLADGLLGTSTGEATAVQILLFTSVHFLAFVLLGILACLLTELTPVPKTLLVGALYGLFAHSLLLYPSLVVSGAEVVNAPGWPIVVIGNVVAGIVLMRSLRRTLGNEGPIDPFHDADARTMVSEGIVAGLIGAAVVAAWFFVLDLASGRLLFTPAALGPAMLYGVGAADGVIVSPGTVLGYTLYHLAAFTLLGIIVSALLAQVERFPPLIFGLFILFVVFETFVVFVAALLGAWIMQELAWWAIIVGNLLAALSMGLYFRWRRPALGGKLSRESLWEPGGSAPGTAPAPK